MIYVDKKHTVVPPASSLQATLPLLAHKFFSTKSSLLSVLLHTIMNVVERLLSIPEGYYNDVDISNDQYRPVFSFIKTRGVYGKREIIVRMVSKIGASDYAPSVVRMAIEIARHKDKDVSDLRMASIVLAFAKYAEDHGGDSSHMTNIVEAMEDKKASDSSRRHLAMKQYKLEEAEMVAASDNRIRKEHAKMREAEASMREAEACMREAEYREREAREGLKLSVARTRMMESQEETARITLNMAEMAREDKTMVEDRCTLSEDDLMNVFFDTNDFELLDVGVPTPDSANVAAVEDTASVPPSAYVAPNPRKVQDGTITMVPPTSPPKGKRGRVDPGPEGSTATKKQKSTRRRVTRVNPVVILGEGVEEADVPSSKSDRLAQVVLAISETGGGMQGTFSTVWNLIEDMRNRKRQYNAENNLVAPGEPGVNDLVVRINLNNMLYEEKYLPLRQYVAQATESNDRFIQNAFSLVSKQTGIFQKRFPSISYCKLGTQCNSQAALVINMALTT